LKKFKPIIVVAGEPNSIFLEIFFKSLKEKIKSPIILICSYRLLKLQMNKFNFKKKIRVLELEKLSEYKLNNQVINIINVNYSFKNLFEKISKRSNNYIENSFKLAFKIIKLGISNKLINGPISKKNFLEKRFLGITEYISKNFKVKNNAMLIYNKRLSVCPLTTHLPLKFVTKNIKPSLIQNKIELLENFYKKNLKIKPKIAVLGLNPHCESIDKINEDKKIVSPIIKKLKRKNYKISGPHSADTIFLKKNREKFNLIIGMYHDQVLTPMKTLYEYDAINITLGLPFVRVSPDHGPNEKMMGKNLSNPLSLIKSFKFLDRN
tara:strand:- start:160 stop:1125 length:966 start_codon:yes stop_codon:yes gene_type:complete